MDTQFLAQYAELEHGNVLMKKLPFLKLAIFDVDGVLTDGGLYFDGNGEMIKRFNVKDGVALKLLPQWGVDVAVITAKDSAPLRKRMSDLGIKHVYYGCHDKAAAFDDLMKTLKLEPEQVAYVGDDVIDLQVMPKIGVSLCPNDAHILLLRHCDICLHKAGGQGVAREVADLILATRMDLEAAYELAKRPEFEKK
ncbi:3-deoxy-D-manno-octulosonate 8-phosphate phosphatase KdsC [Marinomonas gallaica]|uniref:3-deoxy-D-manno-octulosonate 8-phosphate phosphatase KdsC n=1 Tax=Marinomonas gallaica TaxID=1806667 RepID=A0A1C3JN11_9GAMM|nr:HAD-IIIA family hydrolase [Marinomonas gallaica]SBT16555.1 3-deoxy-D-manno-octulosonate 8-phosphate phosphatase KdsC [Marinomonas gallaica]SBT20271.1 3-deoxy-D-manno-octulosonate 8-phosphate phosphatase KdsC [Marinomonas gallaica]